MIHKLRILNSDNTYSEAILKVVESPENVILNLSFDGYNFQEIDEFPFVALNNLRESLVKMNRKICCKGARVDVYPSGAMLIGFNGYKLNLGRPARKIVKLFDTEEDTSLIVSVEEQKAFFNKWLNSL